MLVLLVLPSAQIKLGAAQLHGLIGSYTSGNYPGDYWAVTYSSQGTTTWDVLNAAGTLTPHSQPWSSTGNGDSIDTGGMDATCVGTVTPTLTWVPAPGMDNTTDPPPTQVIVTENGYAHYLGGGSNNGPGTLSDGWSADTPPNSPNNIYGPHYYYTASGTHYEVKDGTSGTITLSAFSLNASTPGASNFAAGNDEVAVTANLNLNLPNSVFMVLTGPTKVDGKYNILVGQGCGVSLPALPAASTTYTWTVSGTRFQDWQDKDPANPQASYYVDGPGPLTNSTAHWFWNDPGPTPTDETVTCAAIVTPNDGKNAPYTVNVTQKITVQVPTWKASGVGGYMKVNNHAPPEAKGQVCLWAGPQPGQVRGMNWLATSTTPQTPVAFGTGTLELVQLVTPNRSYITKTNPPVLHTDPEKKRGLDSGYPYPLPPGAPAYTEGGAPFVTGDSPWMSLVDYYTGSATMAESFDDYLMYQPPGTDARWVPLANFTWTTDGKATMPGSNLWGDYVGSGTYADGAGTVTPSTSKLFTPWNTHPKWTLINTFHSF